MNIKLNDSLNISSFERYILKQEIFKLKMTVKDSRIQSFVYYTFNFKILLESDRLGHNRNNRLFKTILLSDNYSIYDQLIELFYIIFQNMILHLVLFSLCLLISTIKANQQLTVPETFGLTTVTHARGNNMTHFFNYMKKYAMMDCPIISEINIVWNNQMSPESVGIFKNSTEWKRPVYFFQTPNNSMDWRYMLSNQSKAEVFFSIDDDISLNCSQLMSSFKVWQKHAIGNIGPIVTYGLRFFQYTQKQGFKYGKAKQKDMFSVGLVGVSFISRYFMNLYYADIQIFKQMRKIVRLKNNCDDIALNWIITYFFPELQAVPVFTNREILGKGPKVSQALTKTHYPYRSQCVRTFTYLFGINPLRYTPIFDASNYKSLRFHPLRRQIVLAKKAYFDQFMIDTNKDSEQVINQNSNMTLQCLAKFNYYILQSDKLQLSLSQTKIQNQKLRLKQKALEDEIRKILDLKSTVQQTNKEQSAKIILITNQMNKGQKSYYLIYFLLLVIIVMGWRLIAIKNINENKEIKDIKDVKDISGPSQNIVNSQSNIQIGEESSKIYHANE